MTDLTELDGVGDSTAEQMISKGYVDIESLSVADPEVVQELLPNSYDAEEVIAQANELVEEEEDGVEDDVDEFEEDVKTTGTLDWTLSHTQRNHLVAALVDREMEARKTNDPRAKTTIESLIQSVIDGDFEDLTRKELDYMYTSLTQRERHYRSQRGVGSFISILRDMQQDVKELRNIVEYEA